jgi:hypothetical protein
MDHFAKRSWVGLSRCFICENYEETIQCLLVSCFYNVQIGKEVAIHFDLNDIWRGQTMEECLKV